MPQSKKGTAFISKAATASKRKKSSAMKTLPRRTYVGFKLDEMMKSSSKVRKSTKISDAEISVMLKRIMDEGKYRNISNPVPRTMQELVKETLNSGVPLVSKYTTIPFVRVGMEFINRISSESGTTDPKESPKAMEFSIAPPLRRDIQDGKMYYQKIHIDEGKKTKMMQAAMTMYGTKTFSLHCTGSKKVFDGQYSQSGINRKGIYAPIYGMTGSGGQDFPSMEHRLESAGSVPRAAIRKFIYEHAMSPAVADYMEEANAGNLDIGFPITGTTSIHRIRNKMEFTPVDLSIYILRCRRTVLGGPWDTLLPDWNLVGNTLTTTSRYMPVNSDTLDAGTSYQRTWIFPVEQTSVSQTTENGLTETQTFSIESSVRLGVTPAWSPTFNRNWSICDVRKQRINPADILEFHFEQSYNKMTSLRSMIGQFGNFDGTSDGANLYLPGDYEILITYQGIPGYCEGNPTTETLEVDALKSRISKSVEHRIRYAWPTLATGNPSASTQPEELRRNGWITTKVKTATDERRTDYFSSGYNARVVTDQQLQTGGPI